MTDLNPVDAMTTNPYRAMCAELLEALEIQLDELRFDNRLCIRARALLAEPVAEGPTDEDLEDLAEVMNVSGNPVPAMRRTLELWGRPAPQPPAAGEVAVAAALIELRSTVMGLDQMKMYVAAQRVGRAADLLERLASDNAGLEAAADSLWADNVSLLDN